MANSMLMTQTNEAHLLARAQELDSQALAEIHDRYYAEIYRYSVVRTGEQDLAEDIASEVFVRLLNTLHRGSPPHTTLRGWLYGVASHLVFDHYRRKRVQPLDELQADGHSTQAEAEHNLLHAEVRSAMQQLTPEQQEVLALRFGSGFSVEETAQQMKRSVTAVKGLQFRAVESLRRGITEG